MTSPRQIRLSVQTKVLLVVLAFLILLPTLTVWIVNRHITRQMQDEAAQTLSTAEAVFLKSLEIRSRDLLSRFRNVVNEPRFKAMAQTGDARTITHSLRERLEEFGEDNELILYVTPRGEILAGARRDTAIPLDAFSRASMPITRAALAGELGGGSVSTAGRTYNVVSVPVLTQENGELVGALTIGIRVGESAVQDLKSLTRTEILLVADGQVTAATLTTPELSEAVLRQLDSLEKPDGVETKLREERPVIVNGEHFLARAGGYDLTLSGGGFRYVLLSSYEQKLQALAQTGQTLIFISVLGVLISAAVVWFFIRRIIRPLRDLRDSAEAVGQGDFSRRIEQFSNDECGELAEAFNRMISYLRSSRAELEKTVDTLKTTQAQLVQSEKLSAVGQFVAGVAHELNNPLTAVIGFSDLLRQTEADEKLRPYLEHIAKSAQRCHRIVQSLLSFARQHSPEQKRVDVHKVIDDVVEIMAYDLRTSNIAVVRDFEPNLPMIMADPHQLQQVFVNIMSNARQAMPAERRDGRIVLRTRAAGLGVRIEFEDNGPGIAPEHLSRIFDPFFTTKPVGKGTGLGMSLAYGIIQEHGGTINVRSELGHGAAFVIELPAMTELPTPHSAAPIPLEDGHPKPVVPQRILVVDDEDRILHLTRELLRRDGHAVETAISGEIACELLRRQVFDVVISDWKMPGLSGPQLYEQAIAAAPGIAERFLFMSGDVVNEKFQEFLRRHGKVCLSKPFSIAEFRAAIAQVVGRIKRAGLAANN